MDGREFSFEAINVDNSVFDTISDIMLPISISLLFERMLI